MEPGKTVVCAGVFLLAVGEKKIISQKILLCLVLCINENWVVPFFQNNLVLYSVKCKGWPFESILVWRSRSWIRVRVCT